jgi:hypothetical protein
MGCWILDDIHEQECCNDHELHHCDFERYTKLCNVCTRLLAETCRTLTHNLAIGAALCSAFWEGWEQHEHHDLYSAHGYRTEMDWRPGCGRPAP